jgi:uncharacterized protein
MCANGQGIPRDDAKAFAWYLKAAEQGDADAQWIVAVLYHDGTGVAKDLSRSIFWYQKGVAQGREDAGTMLAQMYRNGEGTPKDLGKALEVYRQIGDDYSIGHAYHLGSGVERDDVKAMEFYLKAANAGYAFAPCFIGKMYLDGVGVPHDKIQAYRWMTRSQHDIAMCDVRYAQLVKNMTPSDLDRAESDPADVDARGAKSGKR